MRQTFQLIATAACATLLAAPALAEFRTLDGGGNNLAHPDYGRAGSDLTFTAPPAYADGLSAPAHPDFPNPRAVSNAVVQSHGDKPDPRGLSQFTWQWGQFIDHDLALVLPQPQSGGELVQIPIPANDPVYRPGSFIPMTRSTYDPATGVTSPRRQPDNLTPWIDASQVYGANANEAGGTGIAARSDWLRTHAGGRLKMDASPVGDLLPRRGADPAAPYMDGGNGADFFVAGDIRADEQPSLTSMQTLFAREHNRLADRIDATATDLPTAPAARDEAVFQRARKIVGAEIQSITYNQWLPSLGVTLKPYAGYDASVNPAIATEFATAGFRVGHTMITGTIPLIGPDGQPAAGGSLDLYGAFFNPSVIESVGGIEPILRGLAGSTQQTVDVEIADQLRSLLFIGMPSDGPVTNGTDLAALNLARARDHGVADYNSVRAAYGLAKQSSFADLTSDPALQAALASVYADVDHMDLWIGMLAEDHVAGSSVGELNAAILADQFARLRDGDRLYYAADPDLLAWDAPLGGVDGTALDWLNRFTLSDLLRLDAGLSVQNNVFFAAPAAPVPEPAGLLLLAAAGFALPCRKPRRPSRIHPNPPKSPAL